MEIIIKVGGRSHTFVFNRLTNIEEYRMLDVVEFAAMKGYFDIFKRKGKIIIFDEIKKGGTRKQKMMAQKILKDYFFERFEQVMKGMNTIEDMFKEK